MIETMLWRIPVSRDAITIAVKTPITIPSTVRKLRNLWPRILSSAMPSVSRSVILGIFDPSLMKNDMVVYYDIAFVRATIGSMRAPLNAG